MLAVRIELQGVFVMMAQGVFHAGLEGAGTARVRRQGDDVVSAFPADGLGAILGAIVDDHVIDPWRVLAQVLNRAHDVLLLVVRRDNRENLTLHVPRPFPFPIEHGPAARPRPYRAILSV